MLHWITCKALQFHILSGIAAGWLLAKVKRDLLASICFHFHECMIIFLDCVLGQKVAQSMKLELISGHLCISQFAHVPSSNCI